MWINLGIVIVCKYLCNKLELFETPIFIAKHVVTFYLISFIYGWESFYCLCQWWISDMFALDAYLVSMLGFYSYEYVMSVSC